MVNDVRTVIWKEWKELVARSARSRSDAVKTIIVAGVILGIIVWRSSFMMNNLNVLFIPSFVMVQLLLGIMADSFAGERERHTLETLLASRLSDLAILIGKIVAGVLLAWGLIALTLGLGIAAAYLRRQGPIPLSLREAGALLAIYFFVCLLVSCAAVLVSLRASTVRQAMQTLAWSFVILVFSAIFAVSRIPSDWRLTLLRFFAGEHLLRTELLAMVVLAVLALILFGAARLRFQRARLILL